MDSKAVWSYYLTISSVLALVSSSVKLAVPNIQSVQEWEPVMIFFFLIGIFYCFGFEPMPINL